MTKDDCYCETHHIIPKSEGGKDEPDNLVNLTAREHYIAHLLLAKIYDDVKMYSAVTYMQTTRHKGRTFKFNSRLYEALRKRFFSARKGYHHTKSARIKMSEAKRGDKHPFYGKHLSEEHRRRLSEAKKGERHPNYGNRLSEETRRKMSKAHKGKIFSEGTRRKLSEIKKGNTSCLGRKWFNNGIKNVRAVECPEGFVAGRIVKNV